MCAHDDIGVWQTALQLLDHCPLLGSSRFGVLAPDDHVAWCHGFAEVFWELREVLTQTLRAIMHVSWPVTTGCKYLVGDRFDRFVHRENAGCLPRRQGDDPAESERQLFFRLELVLLQWRLGARSPLMKSGS